MIALGGQAGEPRPSRATVAPSFTFWSKPASAWGHGTGVVLFPVQPGAGPALAAPMSHTPSASVSTWAREQPLLSTATPAAVPAQRSLLAPAGLLVQPGRGAALAAPLSPPPPR